MSFESYMKRREMKKSKFLVLGIGLAVLLLLGVGNSQAALMNWTETNFDASSGHISFEWDEASNYQISFPSVLFQKEDILGPGGLFGSIYQLTIPNFYDPLPLKIINVTMKGSNSSAQGLELARVLDVDGSDSQYGIPSPALPTLEKFIDGTLSSELVTELWHVWPNPDFEVLKIWAPAEFELQSIEIVTQSVVPIPQTIFLLGSGLVALLGIARRRMSK
jgi:hypothetical protein